MIPKTPTTLHTLNNPLRFSGYQLTAGQKAKLFLPGHASAQAPYAEILPETATDELHEPERMALVRQGNYWVTAQDVNLGDYYRFMVKGQPVLDYSDQVSLSRKGVKDETEKTLFNHVFPFEAPQKAGPMLDIFSDALLSKDDLEPYLLDGEVIHQKSNRDHYVRYKGNELGLDLLLDKIDTKNAFRSVLFKPFIGGDNLSAHKYWTADPYVLNDTFSSRKAFKDSMLKLLKKDKKVFADGAFVNQGLNGVQILSNLQHGLNSPYWEWFNFSEEENGSPFPDLIKHDKMTFGVLPVMVNPKTKQTEIDFSRFEIEILNDPTDEADYKDDRPTYIKLVDPKLKSGETFSESTYSDSVQAYRFPVSPKELAEKRKILAEKEENLSLKDFELAEKEILTNWEFFQLGAPSADNSSVKWNGQIDVMKMNMENPEVRSYIQNAMVYWSRLLMNTYTEEVATELFLTPSASFGTATESKEKAWLNRIGQITGEHAGAVLPAYRMEAEKITEVDIHQAISEMPEPEESINTETVVQALKNNYPLSALELPETFKATLSFPLVTERLFTSRDWPEAFLGTLLKPLLWTAEKLGLFEDSRHGIERFLDSSTFASRLASKLDEAIAERERLTEPSDKASNSSLNKLRHNGLLQLMNEPLGEELYHQLLTGLHSADYYASKNQVAKTRDESDDAFYETVPDYIRMADPSAAADLLPRFMKERLDDLDMDAVLSVLEKKLETLDPESVAVANMLLKKREFGLNWRIDATKDIGDMDRVLNANESERPPLFREEIKKAKDFFTGVSERLRDIFPKMTIIGELTDFGIYSGKDQETIDDSYQMFFSDNTLTSTPNMDYMFSSPVRMVHFDPRPDEFGDRNIQPNDFYEHIIKGMTKGVPWPSAMNYQNLTSSHDFSTTAHRLLLNPEIFTSDLLRWHGLNDDLSLAAQELTRKACFAQEREELAALGIENLEALIEKIAKQIDEPKVKEKFSKRVAAYVTNAEKEAQGNAEPTPRELKPIFIQELFKAANLKSLRLSKKQADKLQAILTTRISEPSEARAMRGVVNNALETVELSGLAKALGLPQSALSSQMPALKESFYRALNQVIEDKGQHFGYEPLHLVLQSVAEEMLELASLKLEAKSKLTRREFLAVFNHHLYNEAKAPVMEKQQRVAAIQVALPGNPTIYLPDLLAQSGGELIKNMFLHNRNLIRHDWLEGQNEQKNIRAHADAILDLMRLRTDYPVLNDGFVLKPNINDADGILPVIRDNGTDQAIMLVNTGLPEEQSYDNKVGDGPLYASIQTTQHVKKDYQLDLSNLDIAEGTVYKDVKTKKLYTVNAEGRLLNQKTKAGIDVPIYSLLIRQTV